MYLKKFDYPLLITAFLLIGIGFILIYSATFSWQNPIEWKKQIFYFLIGFIFLIIFTFIDYEFWEKHSKNIYFLNILLLTLVLIFGHSAKGAQRWIQIGPMIFQPSEFAKLFIIITLASTLIPLSKAVTGREILNIFIYAVIPLGLIFLQPDLGSSLVILAITFSLLFLRGIQPKYLIFILIAGVLISPFVLKDYQKQRFLVFLNPEADSKGAGWNLIQSKIAIGSGKIFGKGFLKGSQGQLNFVPEHFTDFIFTVAGEEWGFLGTSLILFLYFILIWRIFIIIQSAKEDFAKLIASGIMIMFLFHIFVNIGMTMGIMPVTGIPLPFLSYGGSSLIVNLISIGLLLSIHIRREKFF